MPKGPEISLHRCLPEHSGQESNHQELGSVEPVGQASSPGGSSGSPVLMQPVRSRDKTQALELRAPWRLCLLWQEPFLGTRASVHSKGLR